MHLIVYLYIKDTHFFQNIATKGPILVVVDLSTNSYKYNAHLSVDPALRILE